MSNSYIQVKLLAEQCDAVIIFAGWQMVQVLLSKEAKSKFCYKEILVR